MSYPSQDDIVQCTSILPWIDEYFLRSDPYAFKDFSIGFRSTAALISKELDVDRNGIFCIGSGAVGLSLDPGKMRDGNLKRYDDRSDIDLAIISEVHFETAWRDLRRKSQPTLDYMEQLIERHINWQRKRFFDGAIVATHLIPALSFAQGWQPALVRIEEHVSRLLDREISLGLWIYRDYWSLRNYVSDGLMKCKRRLTHDI